MSCSCRQTRAICFRIRCFCVLLGPIYLFWWLVSNEEVLTKVEKNRQIMEIIQQRQRHWIAQILRHESLLLDIIEGQMNGRPTRGRRRLQMLEMLAKDGYVAMKWEAEDKESHVKNLLHSRILEKQRGSVTLCLVYFLFVVVWLSTTAVDCLKRLVSEMMYYVSSETLNQSHSLTLVSLFHFSMSIILPVGQHRCIVIGRQCHTCAADFIILQVLVFTPFASWSF